MTVKQIMLYEGKNMLQPLHEFCLTEDDLTNEAKSKFPFHTNIVNSLNFCSHHILQKNKLTAGRSHLIYSSFTFRSMIMSKWY